MKRGWLTLVLALVMLCKCEAQPRTETAPSDHILSETKPTESVGFSDFFAVAEKSAGLQSYELTTGNAEGFAFFGEDILILSGGGQPELTLLDGKNLETKAEAPLSFPVLGVGESAVTYLDESSQTLVFLDRQLKESGRFALPEGCLSAVLSSDQRYLFYCTADALRVLDLSTQLDRLLREMQFPQQELAGIHWGDSVLECRATYPDGTEYTLFLSARTGALLQETPGELSLQTWGGLYFTTRMDGDYRELIVGSEHFGPSVLVPPEEFDGIVPVLDANCVVLYRYCGDRSVTLLDCFDLVSGIRRANAEFPGRITPVSICPDPHSDVLWVLYSDPQTQRDMLCQWNTVQTDCQDSGDYLQNRWSRSEPDLAGLEQCRILAAEIAQRHGVKIDIWTDVPDSLDQYALLPEYQVPLIRKRLQELDQVLACYPDTFLQNLSGGSLRICLVREIRRTDAPVPEVFPSLSGWDPEGYARLIVTMGESMKSYVHYELFRLADSRILSLCSAFDNWNKLNPPDFRYTCGTPSAMQQTAYLSGANRYFADSYALTGPAEDRARIMMYAISEGQEELFRSEPLQVKLRQICIGIREVFSLEPNSYLWEQYLLSPLP